MNRIHKSLTAIALTAAFAAPAAVHAETAPQPEQTRGVAWGAAVGALAGGPLGAIIGATGGGFIGHKQGVEAQLEQTRNELAEAQAAAQSARAELTAAREATAEFAAFAAERDVLDEALFELAEGVTVTYPFRTGSAEVESHVTRQLERMGRALAVVPRIAVHVDGFADVRGADALNRGLSERRARAVAKQLQESGVAAERIRINAHGTNRALAGGDDAEGWFFDRRVVVSLSVGE